MELIDRIEWIVQVVLIEWVGGIAEIELIDRIERVSWINSIDGIEGIVGLILVHGVEDVVVPLILGIEPHLGRGRCHPQEKEDHSHWRDGLHGCLLSALLSPSRREDE